MSLAYDRTHNMLVEVRDEEVLTNYPQSSKPYSDKDVTLQIKGKKYKAHVGKIGTVKLKNNKEWGDHIFNDLQDAFTKLGTFKSEEELTGTKQSQSWNNKTKPTAKDEQILIKTFATVDKANAWIKSQGDKIKVISKDQQQFVGGETIVKYSLNSQKDVMMQDKTSDEVIVIGRIIQAKTEKAALAKLNSELKNNNPGEYGWKIKEEKGGYFDKYTLVTTLGGRSIGSSSGSFYLVQEKNGFKISKSGGTGYKGQDSNANGTTRVYKIEMHLKQGKPFIENVWANSVEEAKQIIKDKYKNNYSFFKVRDSKKTADAKFKVIFEAESGSVEHTIIAEDEKDAREKAYAILRSKKTYFDVIEVKKTKDSEFTVSVLNTLEYAKKAAKNAVDGGGKPNAGLKNLAYKRLDDAQEIIDKWNSKNYLPNEIKSMQERLERTRNYLDKEVFKPKTKDASERLMTDWKYKGGHIFKYKNKSGEIEFRTYAPNKEYSKEWSKSEAQEFIDRCVAKMEEKNKSEDARPSKGEVLLPSDVRRKANAICSKYSKWIEPKDLQTMYKELEAIGVSVGAVLYGKKTTEAYYKGEEVTNSKFVYSVYKDKNRTDNKNEYTIYFS